MDLFSIDEKDLLLFDNIQEVYVAYTVMGVLWLSELAIWLYTCSGRERRRGDVTLWFVIGAWCYGVFAGKMLRDNDMPAIIRDLLFPHVLYYVGVVFVLAGVSIRLLAVITLKHAFTHNVQTTDEQHLIETGLYSYVRNPAYTGSIVSLIGVTFMYRSISAFLSVLTVCAICYGIRIVVEESALKNQFGSAFTSYCLKVKYRIFPGIF